MVQLVISSDLRFKVRTFCPAFFNGKPGQFRKVANILPVNYHSKIDVNVVIQTCINTFYDFAKSSLPPFQKTPAIVDGFCSIKSDLYFTNVTRTEYRRIILE